MNQSNTMKKILLIILAGVTLNLGTFAQDSTAFVAEESISIPGGPTFPKSYASVQTLAGSNLRLTGDWTIEAWVKIGISNGQKHIVESYGFGNTGGFALRISGSKILAYQISGPSTSSSVIGTTVIPTGEWHHIAATLNETTDELSVYLDGVLEGTTTTTINTLNNNSALYIGARGDDQQVSGIVEIDNVRIWDNAKTASEISSDTLVCFTGNETGLLAMYDFENLSGSVLVDRTPNGNTGNLMNAAFSTRIYTCQQFVSSITVQGEAGASTITTNGGTLQMEATLLPLDATDSTYTWSVANVTGSASINTSGLLTANSNGTVTVTATANDETGITGTAVITLSNQVTGINKLIDNSLSIYPNPTSGLLEIISEFKINNVKILDFTGRVILSSNSNTVDLTSFENGIYFVEVKSNKGLTIKKVVKQ